MSSSNEGASPVQSAPAQGAPLPQHLSQPSRAVALGWALGLGSTVAFSFAPPVARAAILDGMDSNQLLMLRMVIATTLFGLTIAVTARGSLRLPRQRTPGCDRGRRHQRGGHDPVLPQPELSRGVAWCHDHCAQPTYRPHAAGAAWRAPHTPPSRAPWPGVGGRLPVDQPLRRGQLDRRRAGHGRNLFLCPADGRHAVDAGQLPGARRGLLRDRHHDRLRHRLVAAAGGSLDSAQPARLASKC